RQPATATASPSPTLSIPHDRLMIAYESSSPDKPLILLDPDHGLSLAFDFPAGSIFATSFLEGLSPDARYFVYYEGGTVDDYGSLNAKPPDFKMRILDLNTQDVIFSAPLLSPDFPKNLEPIVAMTEDEFWREEPDREVKLKEMNYTMQMTVLNYLRTVAWSPDGSILAFASQNPGPSSDMYFFDPAKASARKMTSELGHVLEFTWAPDSSAIALETTLYDRHMRRVTTDLISHAGSPLGSVEYIYFHGWLNPTTITLFKEIDFGDPYFDLTLMSVADNSLTDLWETSFENYAISPDLSSALIGSSQPNEPGESPGLYLTMRDTETPLYLSEASFWKVAYWGSQRFAFAASAPNTGIFDIPQTGGTYGVSQTGELYRIDDGNWYLLPSPDNELLAAYGPFDQTRGLRVFDGQGELLASLSDEKITCLQWSVATNRLAYQVENRLYMWEEGDESARQIADSLQDPLHYGECGFRWVNDKP
ncbi:MAG: hypothetical protein ACWGO1_11730, partial [Anaerolineales bacterium]